MPDINVETLLDHEKLAGICAKYRNNKITFKDTSCTFDHNRNMQFQNISIIDDLNIDTAGEIGKLNQVMRTSYYNSQSVDVSCDRTITCFYQTGNKQYALRISNPVVGWLVIM